MSLSWKFSAAATRVVATGSIYEGLPLCCTIRNASGPGRRVFHAFGALRGAGHASSSVLGRCGRISENQKYKCGKIQQASHNFPLACDILAANPGELYQNAKRTERQDALPMPSATRSPLVALKPTLPPPGARCRNDRMGNASKIPPPVLPDESRARRENKPLSEIPNYDKTKTSRAHYGGRFAIATMRCAGSGGRYRSRRRARPVRTAKSRGRGSPMLGSSLSQSTGDGG